jgi:thiol-disulfide isomerase/thioredoxin
MFVYIVLFIVLCVSIYLVYKYSKYKPKGYVENNEYKEKIDQDKGDVFIFYAKWCPHSKKTLEKMKTIQKKYNHLSFTEIDSEKDVDMADAYKIETYPTIVLVYKNEKYYYDAELDETTFDTFINTIMK